MFDRRIVIWRWARGESSRKRFGCRVPNGATHEPSLYERLNQLLARHDFDGFVERQCQRFYAVTIGLPVSLLESTSVCCWWGTSKGSIPQSRDSPASRKTPVSIREFVGIRRHESAPDHTTISRTRRLIDVETHRQVFHWVLELLAERGLSRGRRSESTRRRWKPMRRCDRSCGATTEKATEILKGLARQSGIATPTREDLAQAGSEREKKGSNDEWVNPHDPDAKHHQDEVWGHPFGA